ncbi:hypothetical protein TNCV_3692631 [Trichonephila clavipes]|nr:hypothetical protein TNCV_3692631 [Trichonephila clavipes]
MTYSTYAPMVYRKNPGSLLEIRCDRRSQTVLARLASCRVNCLPYGSGRKVHPIYILVVNNFLELIGHMSDRSSSLVVTLLLNNDQRHIQWFTVYSTSNRLHSKGFGIPFHWFPSHVGIMTNDLADSVPRSATALLLLTHKARHPASFFNSMAGIMEMAVE